MLIVTPPRLMLITTGSARSPPLSPWTPPSSSASETPSAASRRRRSGRLPILCVVGRSGASCCGLPVARSCQRAVAGVRRGRFRAPGVKGERNRGSLGDRVQRPALCQSFIFGHGRFVRRNGTNHTSKGWYEGPEPREEHRITEVKRVGRVVVGVGGGGRGTRSRWRIAARANSHRASLLRLPDRPRRGTETRALLFIKT